MKWEPIIEVFPIQMKDHPSLFKIASGIAPIFTNYKAIFFGQSVKAIRAVDGSPY